MMNFGIPTRIPPGGCPNGVVLHIINGDTGEHMLHSEISHSNTEERAIADFDKFAAEAEGGDLDGRTPIYIVAHDGDTGQLMHALGGPLAILPLLFEAFGRTHEHMSGLINLLDPGTAYRDN
jgi:hypothetical protein